MTILCPFAGPGEDNVFVAMAVSDRESRFVKLYPEENAEARFRISGAKVFYAYCNRHGLFRLSVPGKERKRKV